eukprot:scaffold64299_cov64-Phaeocystis_antarctica.AAC.1
MAPILGTLRAARGPAGPAPGPSWALATSQPVSALYTAHMSCHGGGLESSPLSRLPVLHRSSVRGLVERHCAREGRLGQKVRQQPNPARRECWESLGRWHSGSEHAGSCHPTPPWMGTPLQSRWR